MSLLQCPSSPRQFPRKVARPSPSKVCILLKKKCFTSSDPHHGISRHIFWNIFCIYTYIYIYILTFYLTVYLTSILTFYLPFFLAFYSGILLLTFYSGILFWHYIWHLFWHSIWHSLWHSLQLGEVDKKRSRGKGSRACSWGPAGNTLILGLLFAVRRGALRSTSLHWRSGRITPRSWACCSGPAGTAAITSLQLKSGGEHPDPGLAIRVLAGEHCDLAALAVEVRRRRRRMRRDSWHKI